LFKQSVMSENLHKPFHVNLEFLVKYLMQVLAVVRHRPEVRKISFVAHSLGGLVARYAIARLYENLPKSALSNLTENSLDEEHTNSMHCLEQPCEARIAGLEPVNFITFATPHLGSRGNKQVKRTILLLAFVIMFNPHALIIFLTLGFLC